MREPERLIVIAGLLDLARHMDVTWVEVEPTAVLRLAIESGLSAYDASYLQVSRVIGAPLLTFDERLRRAAAGASL